MPFGPPRGYSDHIGPARARDLIAAASFAGRLGRPLDTCIDINWTRTSAGDDPHGDALELVVKKVRRWLTARNQVLYALWVRENPPKRGPNAHIMLHLPRDYLRALKRIGSDLLPRDCSDLDG